jgi:multidrug efflux pump
MEAALTGSKEIGFTVLSISTSLVAVFIPILLMGGIVGRLFREFAVTLSTAIAVSLVISAHHHADDVRAAPESRSRSRVTAGSTARASARSTGSCPATTGRSRGCSGNQPLVLAATLLTIALNRLSLHRGAEGFFPQQDTGRLTGSMQADQHTSFQAASKLLTEYVKVVSEDPAVENVIAFTGGAGGTSNTARMFVSLSPIEKRGLTADEVIARMRPKLATIPGSSLFLQPVQDLRIGGRASAAQFQFTLHGDDLEELNHWAPRVLAELRTLKTVVDLNSDQQNRGLEADVQIDRSTASRLGITPQQIDEALYDAFGQRQVSTMYTPLNQYHVVMEVDAPFRQNPAGLDHLYVASGDDIQVPLAVSTQYQSATTPLAVNHSGQFRRSRCRSTSRRASRSARRSPTSSRRRSVSACRAPSAAASPAPRRPSRSRSTTSRC